MKKSKIFARKIISVILAALMAASTFTGVLTAYAKSTDDNHDSKLAANFMAWAETTDNQTAEALLDWLDDTLQKAGIAPIKFYGNYVVVTIDLNIYIDSVDGLLDAVRQINGLLDSYGGLLGGDIKNINLSPIASLNSITAGDGIVSQCNRSYRAVNDAKDIIMALAKAIYWNSNDNTASGHTNKNIIGQFLKGKLDLGSILSGIVDVYGLIGNMLGMWSGYQSNLVYNLVANIILTMTGWYTDAEIADYQSYLQGKGGSTWNFDQQLFEKLCDAFLNKIALNITYSHKRVVDPDTGKVTYETTDSSEARFTEIKAWLESHSLDITDDNVATASSALGYDPNLRYEPTTGKIYLFRYGNEKLILSPNTKVYDAVKEALRLVWNSALVPTISTLRVNNNMDWYDGHGGNFDNQFYYWLQSEGLINESDWTAAYTMENLDAYCQAKYVEYGYSYAEDFKAAIRKTFDYDRNIVDEPTYTWADVAENNNVVTAEGRTESILFGKLRYSPIADKIFDMQTGPINLYFMQTGFDNLEAFMDKFFTTNSYTNLIAAVNDLLVAAVYDFFPNSANIGLGDGKNNVTTDISRPVLTTTATTNNLTIAQTISGNLMKMLEYVANVTDENILSAFYHSNGISDKTQSNNLNEVNIEGAVVPLIIACIQVIADTKSIHKLDWSYAKDAEGVAFVALREYLSYSLPKKDYDQLVSTANGYYEAVKDVDGDGKYNLYLDVILPMCRDAVGYLLNSVVPCRDKNGNIWNVYESNPATDKTTIFDILNSVICYYASMDEFAEPSWNTTASKTYGKGVASLLGVVSESTGKCSVTINNTIWENIDNIANSVWPLLGTIQYGKNAKAGQFNSYEFLYEGVILPLLEISGNRTSLTDGKTQIKGITKVLEQLLIMFTTEPVMTKGIDCLVYDEVVASFVNGVFGKRQSSQTYYKILPTSSDMNTSTPFDSMLNASVFAYSKGYIDATTQGSKDNGVLGNLISNIYGALGGNAEETYTEMGKGSWQGLMFIVKAVSYFVPGFLPQLKDHQFNAATVSVNEPSRANITAGANIGETTITISNNATGLNRFYKDKSGNIVADDRYFIVAKSLQYSASPSMNVTFDSPNGKVIAPEESIKISASANGPSSSTLITFILTYDVYLGTAANPTKQKLYSDQQATCYLNLSVDKDWAGKTLTGYDTNTKAKYPTKTTDYTVKQYKKGKNVNVYNNLVINNANPAQVDDFGITENALTGLYAVDENGNAYATFDSETGDVIDINRYDYNVDDTGWKRGTAVTVNGLTAYKGYTYDELQALLEPYVKTKDSEGNVTEYTVPIKTRTHIGLMKIEDPTNAVIKTAETNSSGKYTSVRVDPALVINTCVTASTPTTGISFVTLPTTTVASNVKWLKYDGTTSVKPENYTMKLYGYVGTTTYQLGTTAVTIANTDGAEGLQRKYNSYLQEMAPYQPLDYTDYNAEYASSTTNDNLQKAFKEVVKQIAAPITLENASQLVSTTVLDSQKISSLSTTGDVAFKPATASATTDKMSEKFFVKNGYYYYDEEFKFPVYSNEHLTDADVVNNKDKVGTPVVKNGDLYYIANSEAYEDGWDATTYAYPYYGKTNTLATTETGAQLYEQVQFQYYTTEGKRVNSNDAWTYKFALTHEIIKPNDGTNDYRGFYTKLEDNLTYNVQQAKKNVDTSLMTLITEDIIAARAGMDSVNYDVATYEKMVQIARNGEKLVWVTDVDAQGNKTYTTDASSVEIKEANRLFKKYEDLVISRGYEGTKLEKEIAHLTGTTKNNISATYNELTGAATVSFTGSATPEYGAVVDGQLVNAGETVYSDATWNNYIVKLAKAVIAAQNTSTTLVSDAYVAKKEVVMAENALDIPAAATSYTVSGVVTEAIDNVGTAGTYALENVSIFVNGERVARTAADGSFTIEVPLGVTDVKFVADKGIDRTVSFDGATSVEGAQVGVIALDFNNDGKINATDAALASKNEPSKLTGVNFKSIIRNGVQYNATID